MNCFSKTLHFSFHMVHTALPPVYCCEPSKYCEYLLNFSFFRCGCVSDWLWIWPTTEYVLEINGDDVNMFLCSSNERTRALPCYVFGTNPVVILRNIIAHVKWVLLSLENILRLLRCDTFPSLLHFQVVSHASCFACWQSVRERIAHGLVTGFTAVTFWFVTAGKIL